LQLTTYFLKIIFDGPAVFILIVFASAFRHIEELFLKIGLWKDECSQFFVGIYFSETEK